MSSFYPDVWGLGFNQILEKGSKGPFLKLANSYSVCGAAEPPDGRHWMWRLIFLSCEYVAYAKVERGAHREESGACGRRGDKGQLGREAVGQGIGAPTLKRGRVGYNARSASCLLYYTSVTSLGQFPICKVG